MRYQVANLAGRRHLSAPPSVESSKASMCSLAREFQDIVDGIRPGTDRDLGDLERAFNEHMDNTIRQGESYLDTFEYLRQCGVRQNIINEIRPRPFWNNFTGLTAYGGTTAPPYVPPPPTPTPGGGGQPPPPAVPPGVATGFRPPGFAPQPPVTVPVELPSVTEPELPPQPPPMPTPTPAPARPPAAPPPVASGQEGCWFVMGHGYVWGPRPSGGESTGLSRSDCENLMRLQSEIRPQAQQQAMLPSVPGVDLFAPATAAFGATAFGGEGLTAATSFMGRRMPVKNLGQASPPTMSCEDWKAEMDKALKEQSRYTEMFRNNPEAANYGWAWNSFQDAARKYNYYKREYEFCLEMRRKYPYSYMPYDWGGDYDLGPETPQPPTPPPVPTPPTSGPDQPPPSVETPGRPAVPTESAQSPPVDAETGFAQAPQCLPDEVWTGFECQPRRPTPTLPFGDIVSGGGLFAPAQAASFGGLLAPAGGQVSAMALAGRRFPVMNLR